MATPISMLAINLAKSSFQVCAIGRDGAGQFIRGLPRTRQAALLAEQRSCIVAKEACVTSHDRGRVAQTHGHQVRRMPAAFGKPFVKRQKNSKADAAAIAEAASRPLMRFGAGNVGDAQAKDGRGCCTGEQDGADDLGSDDKRAA